MLHIKFLGLFIFGETFANLNLIVTLHLDFSENSYLIRPF
uniref:Uncharacterized protein n=1 Tax=Arundo donax TaxID=35708 RepID=A0A0A8Y278_ARUDO